MTPGDAPLKFETAFDIPAGKATTFVTGFTSVRQGGTGRYVLKPVADEVRVIHEGDTPTP